MEDNMNKEALKYLVDTGVEFAQSSEKPHFEKMENGDTYMFYKGKSAVVKPTDPPAPDAFKVFSLQGMIDFINADTDGLCAEGRLMLRVVNPLQVALYGPMTGYNKMRPLLASADAEVPRIRYDTYLPPEEFNVMMQTCFVESEIRDTVMTLTGSIKAEQSVQTADDGFSQRVTIARGAATASTAIVRNPFMLAPRRTFAEVAQPESPFVLRFDDKGQVALFAADGGAWKIEAVGNVRAFLNDELHADDAHQNIYVIA